MRYGVVSQRCRMPSMSGAIPPVRTASIRAFQVSRDAMYGDVLHRATFSTRSGKSVAICMAVMPPIDRPHRCARAMPHASSTASASRASCSIVSSVFEPVVDSP